MALGIVEPKRRPHEVASHVPGSSILFDEGRNLHSKHGSGKQAGLVLVPQPSNDPNDPLNWPRWKKERCFWALMYGVIMGSVLSPILSTVGGPIVKEFGITFPQFALLSGWPLLTTGLSSLLYNAIGQVCGKRPLYLIGTGLLLATTIWNSRLTSYRTFVACRMVEGIGNGPFESIILASIGDIFFVHQRGKRVMIYNVTALGSVFFSPIIGGYISEVHGWRMQFYILSAFIFTSLLLIFLCVPEHTYVRKHRNGGPVMAAHSQQDLECDDHTEKGIRVDDAATSPSASISCVTPQRKTFLQELKVYNGRITDVNPLTVILRTLACMFFPTVFWGFLIGGLWSCFNATTVITIAQVFSMKLSPAQLGYINVFPFIGTMLACLVGTVMADSLAKWAARRNQGLFEPEYRMYLVIPGLIIGIPGYFGYGNYAGTEDPKWQIVSVAFGIFAFGTILATAGAYNYVIDAHNDMRMDVTVAMIMMRNLFWWGASQFMSDWLERNTTAHVYDYSGAILAAVTALTVVFYCYGKVFRYLVQKYNPFRSGGWE